MMKTFPKLSIAITAAFVFHALFIVYLYKHTLLLTRTPHKGWIELSEHKESKTSKIEEVSREEILHAFFSDISPSENPQAQYLSSPSPLPKPSEEIVYPHNKEELYTPDLIPETAQIDHQSFPKVEISDLSIGEKSIKSSQGSLFAKELLEYTGDMGLKMGQLTGVESQEVELHAPESFLHQGTALLRTVDKDLSHEWERQLNTTKKDQSLSRKDFFRTQEVLPNSDAFITQIEALTSKQGEIFFKIQLLPKPQTHFKRIPQNIYFLLDRSNSVSKNYYYKTREALAESLQELHPDDRFNILVFDDQIEAMADTPIPASEASIERALNFLEKERHGGLFAATDLYGSLDRIIPKSLDIHRVDTAILLSDGDTYLSLEKQRKTIGGWTKKNQGKVNLFSLAIGKEQNLPLLDLLSSFNRGVLITAPSPDMIGAALKEFMRSIRYPLGRDLQATISTKNQNMTVELFPKNHNLPLFYEGVPYVLYGKASQAEDFILFLQGRHEERWFDIQIPISFKKALPASAHLLRSIAIQRAYSYYEVFLETGSLFPLYTAQELLRPYQIETAFEPH